MDYINAHLLTFIVFLPLVWAIAGLLIPASSAGALRAWTLLGTLVTFGLSLMMYQQFSATGAEFQMTEMAEWIPGLGITYNVGIDGISLWLMLLTTFLMPIATLASFKAVDGRLREYYFLLLALETGMLGA